MIPLFSFEQHAVGVIAVGQISRGFIAIGQDAVGVIAIGQVARGVFVVGQLSCGLIGVGQLAICPLAGLGMLGIGGRMKALLPISLLPSRSGGLPPETSVHALARGTVAHGWVRLTGTDAPQPVRSLATRSGALTLQLSPSLATALATLGSAREALVQVHVEQQPAASQKSYREAPETERVWVATEPMHAITPPAPRNAGWWLAWALRISALMAVTAAWAVAALAPLCAEVFGVSLPFDVFRGS